jgi:TorA maturation chaperone TorD
MSDFPLRTMALASTDEGGAPARAAHPLGTADPIAVELGVLRWLTVGDDAAVCVPAQQDGVFRTHLRPGAGQRRDAVEARPRADFWPGVAALKRAVVPVEARAFDGLAA